MNLDQDEHPEGLRQHLVRISIAYVLLMMDMMPWTRMEINHPADDDVNYSDADSGCCC